MSTRVWFDARPLADPVDRRAVAAHAERMARIHPLPRPSAGDKTSRVIAIVYAVVFVPVSAVLFALAIARSSIELAVQGIALLGMTVLAVVIVIRLRPKSEPERAYRLDLFARANGMEYHPGYDAPALPGMVFHTGAAPRSQHLVRASLPRFVEFGDFQHMLGAGSEKRRLRWGYAAVRLDAPLPHIVLDAAATRPRVGPKLLHRFEPHQRLSLEGDFDRHFSLFCPEGYEADALRLFSPDLMAALIDHAAEFDIEIVDDWLFLYLRGSEATTLDPARWAQLFAVVGALLDRLATWGRWRDERLEGRPASAPVAPDHAELAALRAPTLSAGVAAPGRRLARRDRTLSTVLITVGAVLAGSIAFALPFLLD